MIFSFDAKAESSFEHVKYFSISSQTLSAELPHPVYKCIGFIELFLLSSKILQNKLLENASQCWNRMCKQWV
jgi:hypothetical protein